MIWFAIAGVALALWLVWGLAAERERVRMAGYAADVRMVQQARREAERVQEQQKFRAYKAALERTSDPAEMLRLRNEQWARTRERVRRSL